MNRFQEDFIFLTNEIIPIESIKKWKKQNDNFQNLIGLWLMKYTRIVYDNKLHNFAIIPNTAQNSIDISSTINDKIISPLFTRHLNSL